MIAKLLFPLRSAWGMSTGRLNAGYSGVGRNSRLHGAGIGFLTLAASAFLLTSCYSQLTIPCDMKSEPDERVLEVRRIFNATTNASIPSATLSDFTVDGRDYSSDFAARNGGGPGAEPISRGAIRCTTPCKFATESHVYGFLVSAEGFQPKRVEVAADWLNKSNSCPVILSGATVVEVPLDADR